MKKAKDTIFGGALALQSTNVLSDRSVHGLTNTTTGFVNIGVAGSMADMAYKMAKPKKTKRRYR